MSDPLHLLNQFFPSLSRRWISAVRFKGLKPRKSRRRTSRRYAHQKATNGSAHHRLHRRRSGQSFVDLRLPFLRLCGRSGSVQTLSSSVCREYVRAFSRKCRDRGASFGSRSGNIVKNSSVFSSVRPFVKRMTIAMVSDLIIASVSFSRCVKLKSNRSNRKGGPHRSARTCPRSLASTLA